MRMTLSFIKGFIHGILIYGIQVHTPNLNGMKRFGSSGE